MVGGTRPAGRTNARYLPSRRRPPGGRRILHAYGQKVTRKGLSGGRSPAVFFPGDGPPGDDRRLGFFKSVSTFERYQVTLQRSISLLEVSSIRSNGVCPSCWTAAAWSDGWPGGAEPESTTVPCVCESLSTKEQRTAEQLQPMCADAFTSNSIQIEVTALAVIAVHDSAVRSRSRPQLCRL